MAEGKVLVIEDEENLLEALKYNLEREGYTALTASDGERGLGMARKHRPDLVILDIMLPRIDGKEVCRILRRENDTPIIMLTARGEEVDRVVGLEIGADDYVTKPFSMRELLARLRTVLRRTRSNGMGETAASRERLASGDLVVDLASHTVTLADKQIEMKPREFDLLALLVANKGRAFTRDQILERLWGQDYIGDTRTVDVHIRWIRQKIEEGPGSPNRIVTIRGVGYRFQG